VLAAWRALGKDGFVTQVGVAAGTGARVAAGVAVGAST
jgi:hypothetical protein